MHFDLRFHQSYLIYTKKVRKWILIDPEITCKKELDKIKPCLHGARILFPTEFKPISQRVKKGKTKMLETISENGLLIAAEDGTLLKRPYFESRCHAIGKLRVVTLPGHHHLHLDNPWPVAEVINRYLQCEKDESDETAVV